MIFWPINAPNESNTYQAETKKFHTPSETEKIKMTRAWTYEEWTNSVKASKNHNKSNLTDDQTFATMHKIDKY